MDLEAGATGEQPAHEGPLSAARPGALPSRPARSLRVDSCNRCLRGLWGRVTAGAHLVIDLPLLRVGQHLVGLGHLLELALSELLVVRVLVLEERERERESV